MIVTGSADQRRTRERQIVECVTPALVQFFVIEDRRTLPLGSGVVVPIEDRPCIFTAAHVLAEAKTKEVWASIGAAGERRPLPSQTVVRATGNPAMGNHQGDPIDAAVMLVPGHWRDALPPAPPVSVPSPVMPGTHGLSIDRCMVLGFPANRVKWDKGEITSKSYPLVSVEAPDREYSQLGYDSRDHLLLRHRGRWNRDSVDAKRVKASKLDGVSGAPVFRFDLDGTEPNPELVAIFIEVAHKCGRKRLLATRVDRHVDLARQLLAA